MKALFMKEKKAKFCVKVEKNERKQSASVGFENSEKRCSALLKSPTNPFAEFG